MSATREFNERNLPESGWNCVDVIDLRARDGHSYAPGCCERCDNETLRFCHVLEHNQAIDRITVGRKCAAKLCYYYDADDVERELKNLFDRRRRWPNLQWRISRNGNPYLKRRVEGRRVTVIIIRPPWDPNRWNYMLVWNEEDPDYGDTYGSIVDAQLAAFDRLEELKKRSPINLA